MTRKLVNDHRILNDINQYLDLAVPLVDQTFSKTVDLRRLLTGYSDYTVEADITIAPAADGIQGGCAEINLIADGSHTPTFSGMTKSEASEDWDTTEGKIHKTVFYYDGSVVYYSHTYLN